MTKLALVLLLATVSGCNSMLTVMGLPTQLEFTTSIMDKHKTLYVPAQNVRRSAMGGSDLSMGFIWSSKYPKYVSLIAGVDGTFSIPEKNSLVIDIDGERHTLSSNRSIFTDIDYDPTTRDNFSSRTYKVKVEVLARMLKGKRVAVQLGGFAEGFFNFEGFMTAKKDMQEGYDKIKPLL